MSPSTLTWRGRARPGPPQVLATLHVHVSSGAIARSPSRLVCASHNWGVTTDLVHCAVQAAVHDGACCDQTDLPALIEPHMHADPAHPVQRVGAHAMTAPQTIAKKLMIDQLLFAPICESSSTEWPAVAGMCTRW